MKDASTGKSYIYLTIAKFLSILAGYAILLFIARMLTPEDFGVYGVIVSIVSIINMVVITGTVQSVSKFVSQNEEASEYTKRKALKLQIFVAILVTGLYFALSSVIALIINDKSFTPYLRLSSLIVLFYSFYAVFMGYLNGLKQFKKQSLFDMSYSVIRAGLIIGLTFLTFTVMGSILGFSAASFLILVLALIFVGFKKVDKIADVSYKKIIKFMLPAMAFVFVLNLLLNIDLLAVKALSPSDISNTLSGYYSAALSIARIPYFAIISLTLLIFPFISKATAANDLKKVQYYVKQSLRFSLILLIFLAVIISSNASPILELLYPSAYSFGSQALSIVVFGLAFLGMILISANIITASGKPNISLYIGIGVVVLDFILNFILIKNYSLLGAAVATTIAMFLGFIVTIIFMKKLFKTYLNVKSILKILILNLIIFFVAINLNFTSFYLIIEFLILAIILIAGLFLLKELKISYIRELLKRN